MGSTSLLLGVAGMLLVIFRPALRVSTPLLYLLAFTACYTILQDVFLDYQVNYLSNVYPMFLPFVGISLYTLRQALLHDTNRLRRFSLARSRSAKCDAIRSVRPCIQMEL
jgi:hypothetical protein